jgi:flagellar motor switch/type III secretory pathway protein FliN
MSNDAKPAAEPRRDDTLILHKRWEAAARLQCTLSVELAAPGITVGDLLDLEAGSVIRSHHSQSSSVPVRVNGVTIAQGDFEVIADHLAVRISELS